MQSQDTYSKSQILQLMDTAIEDSQKLQKLLSKLTENEGNAEQLESTTISQEYLQLLGTIVYAQNCIVHSYSQIKNKQIPPQFKQVKNYYQKVQQALKPSEKAEKKSTNEVAKRMIKRNI